MFPTIDHPEKGELQQEFDKLGKRLTAKDGEHDT